MPYPGLLHPEPLPLWQATADLYLWKRHSNTQRQVWLSLCGVSWCAQDFDGHRTQKDVFIPIPKKLNAKECSNYCAIALISHASKVRLKILQTRLQKYVNRELPDVQAGFRKGRGTRDQIANICWIMEKNKRIPEKNIYFCFIDCAKVFDSMNYNKLWKILK